MRIGELQFRTVKIDNMLREHNVQNLLIRGGFIKKVRGKTCYTETGVMMMEKVMALIKDILHEKKVHPIQMECPKNMRELKKEMHEYGASASVSYRDIPQKFYLTEKLKMNAKNKESLWESEYQELLFLADNDIKGDVQEECMDTILKALEVTYVRDGHAYFYQKAEGRDRFSDCGAAPCKGDVDKGIAMTPGLPMAKPSFVHTPGIKSIEELTGFLGCKKDDILKTLLFSKEGTVYAVLLPGDLEADLSKVERILDCYEGDLNPANEDAVFRITGTVPGFIGPVGIAVDRIIIHDEVRKYKGYYTGANQTDYHLRDVRYGRDFAGDFHDVALRPAMKSGWLLGDSRTWTEMVRVQNIRGTFDYFTVRLGFLNLERLLLAMAETRLDEVGIRMGEFSLFEAVIAIVDIRNEESVKNAEVLYAFLLRKGVSVLLDDRKDRMGSKFADYDLLGIEKRIILGKDSMDKMEIKDRNGAISFGNLDSIVAIIRG